MKRTALLCCAALWAVIAAPPASAADPVTLIVDDDGMQCGSQPYKTIGSAVAAARDGDTVTVCPGSYVERVTVTKKINIQGPKDAVAALNCFLPDETQFATLLDPAHFAILSPPDASANSLLSLWADSIEVSGLVVQGQGKDNPTHTTVDNPDRPSPLSVSTLSLYEAAIETDALHSGFNIHDNLIRKNTFGMEFGASGGRDSSFANNCLRDNTFGMSGQRYRMKDVTVTGNKSYLTTSVVYEIGWSLAAAQRVTLTGNVSRSDGVFISVENTNAISIEDNKVNQDPSLDPSARIGGRGVAIYGKNTGLSVVDNQMSHTRSAAVAFLGSLTVVDDDTTKGAIIRDNHLTMSAIGVAINGLSEITGTQILDNELSANGSGLVMQASNALNKIDGNRNNTIMDNKADGNAGTGLNDGYGIRVRAAGNTIESNSMHGNSIADAGDGVSESETVLQNKWVDNNCDTDIPTGMICTH